MNDIKKIAPTQQAHNNQQQKKTTPIKKVEARNNQEFNSTSKALLALGILGAAGLTYILTRGKKGTRQATDAGNNIPPSKPNIETPDIKKIAKENFQKKFVPESELTFDAALTCFKDGKPFTGKTQYINPEGIARYNDGKLVAVYYKVDDKINVYRDNDIPFKTRTIPKSSNIDKYFEYSTATMDSITEIPPIKENGSLKGEEILPQDSPNTPPKINSKNTTAENEVSTEIQPNKSKNGIELGEQTSRPNIETLDIKEIPHKIFNREEALTSLKEMKKETYFNNYGERIEQSRIVQRFEPWEIKNFSKLSDNQLEKALMLANIHLSGQPRFSRLEIDWLLELSDEEFQLAQKELFHIEELGEYQLYGGGITELIKLPKEQFTQAKEYVKSFSNYLEVDEIITIVKCNSDEFKKMSFKDKKYLSDEFAKIYKKHGQKTELSELGLDKIKQEMSTNMSSATSPIQVTSEAKTQFFKQAIALNNGTTSTTIKNLGTVIEQYGKEGLPLSYKRQDFIQDLLKELNKVDDKQQTEILRKLGIEFTQDKLGYNGLLNINNLDSTNLTEKPIKELCERFLLHNSIQTGDKNTDTVLNSLIQGLPEFVNVIGKKHHKTHQYTIDTHIIKVLQTVVNDPKFETLSNTDKMILQLATILHDLAKAEGVVDKGHEFPSSIYAQDILQKFNLPISLKDKIVEMVKNHNWWEKYSHGEISAEDVAVMFRSPEDLTMAEIFAKSDLKGVSETFYETCIKDFDTKIVKCREALEKFYQGGNLLFTTQIVNSDKIPRQMFNGFEYKVINFSQIPDDADLFDYGLSIHKKSDFRALFHTGDYETTGTLSKPTNEGFLCTTLVSTDKNATFLSRPFGMMINCDNKNIINSYFKNQGSDGKRGFRDFVNFTLGNNQTYRHYQRDIFLGSLQEKYNLTEKEYGELYKQLHKKRFLSQIEDVIIGETTIKKEDIIKAYKSVEDSIMQTTDKEHNEINIYNPKVVGIISKSDNLKYIDSDALKFAREHDIPIFILKESDY